MLHPGGDAFEIYDSTGKFRTTDATGKAIDSRSEISGTSVDGPAAEYWGHGRSFDMRHVDGPLYVEAAPGTEPRQAVWVKAFDRLPDDPDLHRAALAYVCDYTILEPLLRAQGLSWAAPGLQTASLDHSLWFHRDGRADEWVLYVQDACSLQRNRGLVRGQFFDRDGRLLATVAQEGMIRPGA